jgi:hypothetical protein
VTAGNVSALASGANAGASATIMRADDIWIASGVKVLRAFGR